MSYKFDEIIWNILACPACGHRLQKNGDQGAYCSNCSIEYSYNENGTLDLRLQKPRKYLLEYNIGTHLSPVAQLSYEPLQENPIPDVDFSNLEVPFHLNRELMSYFPKAKSQDSLMLDLGCGDAIHQAVGEFAGYTYVGIDHDGSKAPFLGDAQSLPFCDNSFEFILSIAVMEHIRYPLVAMHEAFRVLKNGGRFIGTVAFMEPFHLDSFYHHSHLGILNSLDFVGFNIDQVAPSETWTVLIAQSLMGLFPRMPPKIAKSLVWPLQSLSRLWWQVRYIKNHGRNINLNDRVRNTTGAFTFVATKNTHIN